MPDCSEDANYSTSCRHQGNSRSHGHHAVQSVKRQFSAISSFMEQEQRVSSYKCLLWDIIHVLRPCRPIIPKPGSRVKQLQDGTLVIGEVRAADVGDYTCVVSSPGGNDTRSAKLKVIELPYAPVSVRAYRVPSTKTVNVSWTPGFDGNSPIVKFIIQRREIPDTGKTCSVR